MTTQTEEKTSLTPDEMKNLSSRLSAALYFLEAQERLGNFPPTFIAIREDVEACCEIVGIDHKALLQTD